MRKLQVLAATAISITIAMTFAGAVVGAGADEPAGPAGDWNCAMGEKAVGTLYVRSASYMLQRSGSSMSGEYQAQGDEMVVTSGPLRGFGADKGTVTSNGDDRSLKFASSAGTLDCHEVE